jgi:hypothetical protein
MIKKMFKKKNENPGPVEFKRTGGQRAIIRNYEAGEMDVLGEKRMGLRFIDGRNRPLIEFTENGFKLTELFFTYYKMV